MVLMFKLMTLYLLMIIDFFFFKRNTAYEMRISDWSSDVCSSDLRCHIRVLRHLNGGFYIVSGCFSRLLCFVVRRGNYRQLARGWFCWNCFGLWLRLSGNKRRV